jgi:hypothetical protein
MMAKGMWGPILVALLASVAAASACGGSKPVVENSIIEQIQDHYRKFENYHAKLSVTAGVVVEGKSRPVSFGTDAVEVWHRADGRAKYQSLQSRTIDGKVRVATKIYSVDTDGIYTVGLSSTNKYEFGYGKSSQATTFPGWRLFVDEMDGLAGLSGVMSRRVASDNSDVSLRLIDLLRLHAVTTSDATQGGRPILRLTSHGSWGRIEATVDPKRNYLPLRVLHSRSATDLYRPGGTVGSLVLNEMRYVEVEQEYTCSETRDVGSGIVVPWVFSTTRRCKLADGAWRAITVESRMESLDLSSPLPASAFRIAPDSADGEYFNVEDQPQIWHHIEGGRVVKSVDNELLNQLSRKTFGVVNWRTRAMLVVGGLLVMVCVTYFAIPVTRRAMKSLRSR